MNASLEGVGFQKALPALIFLTAMFLLNFMTRTVLSPLLSELEADLAISHAQAGRLFLFLALGVSLGSFANGLVSKRISHRATVSASAFFAGLMLMAASRALSYPLFAAGLFLLGLFSGLYFPSALAAITSYVRKPDWGKAIGVHDSAASLSFILIPLFAELILLAGNWRDTLLAFFERARPTLVGMEACPGSQRLARKLLAMGHRVRIVPAQFVKPYVKSQKNDTVDAEAIAEAVTRPTMRFTQVRFAYPARPKPPGAPSRAGSCTCCGG